MIDEREIPTLYQKLKSHIARDFRPNTATQTIVTGGGGVTAFSQLAGTIGNAQAPQFLLRDGSRSLTGSMAVADGATIDGVDISAHAADPDAHHARQHSIVSSSDHTIAGAALSLVGATGTNTLGLITPSANPGTTESVLKAMGGLLTLPNFTATTAMRTPLIDTASGNLTLQPAGSFVKLAASKGIESNGTFVSGFTGAGLRIDDGITKANKTSIEADNLTIRGTMRVYELVIQQIRMTNGSLLVSSAGKVKAVSGTGPYTMTTDGQHGFAVNDLILAQRWNPTQGALTGLYIYRSALWVTSITTVGTDWHFTAVVLEGDAPIEGAEYGRIGNTTDTSRQGGIYLTSDDTYAPYIDIYNDVDSMADWTGAAKLKARLGRLTGISDAILNPAGYGLYSSNAYLKGALSAANGNVLINDDGVRVRAFADPAGVLADINAYRFERQDGTLVGGLYGGGSSTGHITELVTEAPATGYAFTILKSVGNTSSSTGMADVILQAGNDASPTKEASVWVDVDDTAALVRLIADDFIRLEAPTQSFDTHAPYLDLGADLGSVSKRWGVLHVNQIIAYGSISGASIGGAVWQYPGSMVIDANSGSDTVVNVVNNGAGAVIFDVLGQIRQNGTNVSLVGHLHDDRYVQLGSLGSYLLASGATTGATSQAQAFTNGVRTGNGTALVPAFSFSASDSTGIYRQAADSLSIATVGTERLRVNASGQVSFNGAPITGYVVTAQPATGQTGGMTLEGTYASAGFLFNTSAILRHAAGTTIQAMRWVPTEEPQGAITTFVNINNNLRLDNSAFNVTNVRLVQGQLLSQAGYIGAITSLSMFHALNASLGGATLTNQYGYYCAALSGATNNYAFYSAGSTPSYFGGTVQIIGDAEVTGNLLAANGTVGAPSVAALGDTNTGLYWSAADVLSVATGGGLRASFTSTGVTVAGALTVPTVNTASGNLTIAPAGGTTAVTGALSLTGTLSSTGWSITSGGAATVITAVASTSVSTPSLVTAAGNLSIAPQGGTTAITGALTGTATAAFVTSVSSPLYTAASGNLTVSAPANLLLNAAAGSTADLQINGVSQWIASDQRLNPRGSVLLDVGDINRKVRTLYAAELYVETLVAQDVMATIGGRIMVAPTTTLIADLSSSNPSALWTGIVAYWSLGEASGSRADSKGSNTLTDTNTVGSIAGKIGNAASFTKASSQRLTIADNAALSVGDIDFYVACWVFPTLDDASSQQTIAAKSGSSGNRAWWLYVDWATDQVKFRVFNPSDSSTTVTAAGTIVVNTWYFVEAWHNAATDQIVVAVNGTTTTASHTTGSRDDTGPFQIGASNSGSHFNGYIDEFLFAKYIPTTFERGWLYNAGVGRSYAQIAALTTVDVKHNAWATGDYVYMATAPGGIAQIEAMQVVSTATTITGGYRYSVIRNLDGTGNNTWYAGDAVVDLGGAVGQGYLELTSTRTIHNHYGPSSIYYARTGTANWNDVAPVVAEGNLRSLLDYTGDEFGQAAGNNLTLLPTTGFQGYSIDRTNGLRLFNVDFRLYEGAAKKVEILPTAGLNLLADDSTTNLRQQINWYRNLDSKSIAPAASLLVYTSGVTNNINLTAHRDGANYGASVRIAAGAASIEITEVNSTTATGVLSASAWTITGTINAVAGLKVLSSDSVGVGTWNEPPTPSGLAVNSVVSETARSTSNVRMGLTGGYPRIILEDNNSATQWQVDNYEGTMRFFRPGSVHATLTGTGQFNATSLGGDWTALPYNSSGWEDYGSVHQTGQYKKVGDLIFLRGLVKRTSGSGTTIATLPTGHRPYAQCLFASYTDTGIGRVDVTTAGVISLQAGGASFVQLDGLVFSTIA